MCARTETWRIRHSTFVAHQLLRTPTATHVARPPRAQPEILAQTVAAYRDQLRLLSAQFSSGLVDAIAVRQARS
jgi:hypothetical protein